MAKGVVRTDKMHGTDSGVGLVSFKYLPSGTKTAIENGNVVLLNGLLADSTGAIPDREVYKAVTPAANSAIKDVVLVAGVEVMYDERKKNLDEYENEAGKIVRGFHLSTNDIFAVTADCIDGTAAKDSVIELEAGTKLKAVESLTSGSTQVGVCEQVENTGRYTYYVIRVV